MKPQSARRWALIIALLLASLGVLQLGSAVLIMMKAELAPILIAKAFERTAITGQPQAAWPGADHYVHSRLALGEGGSFVYALDTGGLRAMAFGPIAYEQDQTTIYVAHRDTHFAGLKALKDGAVLKRERPGAEAEAFQIKAIWVADKDQLYVPGGGHTPGILLVTCYPFDAVRAGGRQRYLIWAEKLAQI